jgi:hypothetical protein
MKLSNGQYYTLFIAFVAFILLYMVLKMILFQMNSRMVLGGLLRMWCTIFSRDVSLVLGKLKYWNAVKKNTSLCLSWMILVTRLSTDTEKSNPCAISKASLHSGDINQSASQLWLLAINFPLMAGHFVAQSDDAWHSFTVLLNLSTCISRFNISFPNWPAWAIDSRMFDMV